MHPNKEFALVALLTVTILGGSFAFLSTPSASHAVNVKQFWLKKPIMGSRKTTSDLPLVVEPSVTPMPAPQLVVAGKLDAVPVSDYNFIAGPQQNVKVSSVTVLLSGDVNQRFSMWDVKSLSIYDANRTMLGTSAVGTNSSTVTIQLSTPYTIPAGTTAAMHVYAVFNPVVSTSNCPTDGPCARSGDAVRATIQSVQAVAGSAQSTILPTTQAAGLFVLRKAVPTLIMRPVSTNVLQNGPQIPLYTVQIAPGTETLSWKSLTFLVATIGTVDLTDFSLSRGNVMVPHTDYDVYVNGHLATSNGTTLVKGGTPAARITVAWKKGIEDYLSGSGNSYTLYTSAQNVTGGSAVVTQMYSSGSKGNLAYCLNQDTNGEPMLTATSGQANAHQYGIIWSDVSELPHSATICAEHGSTDWIMDGNIAMPTPFSTVSR